MSTTFAPPEELADAELVALVLPFGEDVDRSHPLAPRRYEWGDVALPRQPVPLREVHDGREIGVLSSFVLDRTGIWAKVKPGKTASKLIAQGITGISAEIDDDRITGATLVAEPRRPAFPSARLYSGQGAVLDAPNAALRFGVDPSTGLVAFPPPLPTRAPAPAPSSPAVVNLSEHRRLLAALAGPDPELEVARARSMYEDRLESLAESRVDWEAHLVETMARNKVVFEAQVVAANGTLAASEFVARMERLEAAAERERRPWWRRLFK